MAHITTFDAASDDAGPTTVDSAAWKALWGSALGYAMDGFDLLILGFMLRVISADLGLSPERWSARWSAASSSACCPTGSGACGS